MLATEITATASGDCAGTPHSFPSSGFTRRIHVSCFSQTPLKSQTVWYFEKNPWMLGRVLYKSSGKVRTSEVWGEGRYPFGEGDERRKTSPGQQSRDAVLLLAEVRWL